MPMKGRFPIRRTLQYLQKGDIIFKSRVKIMTVNYNTNGDLSDGARSVVARIILLKPLTRILTYIKYVLQKIRIFQYSTNSVSKSKSSNNDV